MEIKLIWNYNLIVTIMTIIIYSITCKLNVCFESILSYLPITDQRPPRHPGLAAALQAAEPRHAPSHAGALPRSEDTGPGRTHQTSVWTMRLVAQRK